MEYLVENMHEDSLGGQKGEVSNLVVNIAQMGLIARNLVAKS